MRAWDDAARLADRKWDKIMGEVWPRAQAHVARELGSEAPGAIAFSSNTHEFLVRLMSAVPGNGQRPRVLTTDGEFHSARRQLARWQEEGCIALERVAAEPFDTFPERVLKAAQAGSHDVIFVSHVLFGSGRIFDRVDELAALGRPEGPWVVIDGYHAFMALQQPLGVKASTSAFYLGGGYKYAMAGEGCAFLHAPAGFAPRPRLTGWFAEFEDLSLPPGTSGYAADARRFLGATFDPSGLYRFNAVQEMLLANEITTERMSNHGSSLQRQLLESIGGTVLSSAELLNPLEAGPHARFLAFRSPEAERWNEQLTAKNCITDVRANVLRIGFSIYQDEADVERLAALIGELR
jgi:selenocysteine lyase/cysteine desulfurase